MISAALAHDIRKSIVPLTERLLGYGPQEFRCLSGQPVTVLARAPHAGGHKVPDPWTPPFTVLLTDNGTKFYAQPGYVLAYKRGDGGREYGLFDPTFFSVPLSQVTEENAYSIGSGSYHLWLEVTTFNSSSSSGMLQVTDVVARLSASPPPPDDPSVPMFNVPWARIGALEGGTRTIEQHLQHHHEFRYRREEDPETADAPPPWVNGFQTDPPPAGWCPIGQEPNWSYIAHLWICMPIMDPGTSDPGGSGAGSGGASGGGSSTPQSSTPASHGSSGGASGGGSSTPQSSTPASHGSSGSGYDSSTPGSHSSHSIRSTSTSDSSAISDSSSTSESAIDYSTPSVSKMAIVPDHSTGTFRRWHCVEARQPLFEMTVRAVFDSRGVAVARLPLDFLRCVDPKSIRVADLQVVGEPHLIWCDGMVDRNTAAVIRCLALPCCPVPARLAADVTFIGVRVDVPPAQYSGLGMATRDEYLANQRFYDLQTDAAGLDTLLPPP